MDLSRSGSTIIVAGAVILSADAAAQIAPPPTPAPEKTAAWQPKAREPENRGDPTPIPEWERDTNGRLKALDEPLWWASLRKNQLVSSEDWKKIDPYLTDRRRLLENAVIDNLDLMREVLSDWNMAKGANNRKGIAGRLSILKPLNLNPATPKDMRDRGLLTQLQTVHNEKIGKAYREARRNYLEENEWKLAPNANPEEKERINEARMKDIVLTSFIEESVWAYDQLLIETAEHMDMVPKTLSDPARGGELAAAIARVNAVRERGPRVAEMRKLVNSLSVDQERDMLWAVQGLRPAAAGK